MSFIDANASIIISPQMDPTHQSLGAEDPRVVLFNNTYYMFYTAVGASSSGGNAVARLALATCDRSLVIDPATEQVRQRA